MHTDIPTLNVDTAQRVNLSELIPPLVPGEHVIARKLMYGSDGVYATVFGRTADPQEAKQFLQTLNGYYDQNDAVIHVVS